LTKESENIQIYGKEYLALQTIEKGKKRNSPTPAAE